MPSSPGSLCASSPSGSWLFNKPDESATPEPITKREQIFATATIIILGTVSVISNAYEGFSTLHELNWNNGARSLLSLGCLGTFITIFTLWYRQQNTSTRTASDEALLPQWTPIAVLASIVLAGYLVSVPGELHAHNKILLSLYTAYIAISLSAFGVLFWRRSQ